MSGRPITDAERSEILAKIHVQVLDLEAGAPLERAVLIALTSRGISSAPQAWAQLINLALTLAKDRLSVDRAGLLRRLESVLGSEADANLHVAAEAVLRSALDAETGVSREILAVQGEDRILVTALPRFDSDGSKFLRFEAGKVVLPDGTSHDVLLRTSSVAGLELAANPALLGDAEVLLDLDTPIPENEDAAEAYHAILRQLVADNPALLTCLRCNRPVAENQAPYVEIDEVDQAHEVGLVHAACRRPTHRVIGGLSAESLADNPWLGDFDFQLWLRQIIDGQGMFNGLSPSDRAKRAFVGWQPSNSHLSAGTWGVVLEHADGNEHFITRRGSVETLIKDEAKAQADYMNGVLTQAAAANDPFCVSPETEAFAPYSQLLQAFAEEGEPIEVVRARPRELTRTAITASQRNTNYYAPLLVLIDAERNEPYSFAGAVCLLTDPLRLPDFIANWKSAGVEVPPLATAIIRDDAQFDALVASHALRSIRVVVNPLLRRDGSLLSAIIFAPEILWLRGYPDPFAEHEQHDHEDNDGGAGDYPEGSPA